MWFMESVNALMGQGGSYRENTTAEPCYIASYVDALAGLRFGIYRHSSVAHDTMKHIFASLRAEIVPLAHSDIFIPVDTEAMGADTRTELGGWYRTNGLDAIVSTDGDADRPMLTDASGKVIPGNVHVC